MSEPTDFERQVQAWRMNMAMLPKSLERGPSAFDLIQVALHYDPSQDGLYICQQCGVTWDAECDYGGWHDASQTVSVSVPWMEGDTDARGA